MVPDCLLVESSHMNPFVEEKKTRVKESFLCSGIKCLKFVVSALAHWCKLKSVEISKHKCIYYSTSIRIKVRSSVW